MDIYVGVTCRQLIGYAHKFTCFGDTSHSPNFDVAMSLPFLAKEAGWY